MKYVSAVYLGAPIAILLFLTACEPSSPVSQPVTASPESTADSELFYRGGNDDKVVTAANGAKVHEDYEKFISQGVWSKPVIHNVTDGVWTITGYSLSNYTFIEGETGLIAFDAGNSVGMGATVLEMIQEKVNEPVSAAIYSHFHYIGGTKAYAGG
jgi:alkyl sulfatase BDS1-like metallo-beta-lactamase superfamily hydrolase